MLSKILYSNYNNKYNVNVLQIHGGLMNSLEEIKKILANQLSIKVENIKPESRIVEDLGADSLDVVELLMILEDEKGIVISDEQASKLKTVQDIANLLENK